MIRWTCREIGGHNEHTGWTNGGLPLARITENYTTRGEPGVELFFMKKSSLLRATVSVEEAKAVVQKRWDAHSTINSLRGARITKEAIVTMLLDVQRLLPTEGSAVRLSDLLDAALEALKEVEKTGLIECGCKGDYCNGTCTSGLIQNVLHDAGKLKEAEQADVNAGT